MKIISKKYDYYDNVSAFGVDDIYYKRISERHPFKASERNWSGGVLRDYHINYDYNDYTNWGHDKVLSYYLYVIGFCGEFYPCILVRYRKESTPDKIFYNADNFSDVITTHGYERGQLGDKRKLVFYNKVREFFDPRQYQKYSNTFHKYNCPLFSMRLTDSGKTEVVTNIILSEFHFQAAVDPYSAYQRVSSYISGVLGSKEHELVEISDLSMRDKKGFDKWSFKKKKMKKRK